MANVQHSAIPNADLHEPKGASGAASGTVYVADGAGSGSWSKNLSGGVQIGGGTLFTKLVIYTPTLNPSAFVGGDSTQTFTVVGLSTTDTILSITKPTVSADLFILEAIVSATDTLRIHFYNLAFGTIDPPSEIYTIVALRS